VSFASNHCGSDLGRVASDMTVGQNDPSGVMIKPEPLPPISRTLDSTG